MNVHFIRHTSPNIATGVCYGQADIDLAKSFEQESRVLLNKLSKQTNNGQYDYLFSSPAKRCLLLAEKIQSNQSTPQNNININTKLQEVDFGDWELRTWDDIPRSESQPWTDDFVHVAPPNGESLLTMQKRVHAFIDELNTLKQPSISLISSSIQEKKTPPNSSIAVVTHAGVMRLIAAYYLQIPLSEIFNLKLNYGQIIELKSMNNHHSLRFID